MISLARISLVCKMVCKISTSAEKLGIKAPKTRVNQTLALDQNKDWHDSQVFFDRFWIIF